GLQELVKRIANGDLDGQADALVRAATTIPAAKPDGGVRPIAIGEAVKRVAERYVLGLTPSQGKKLFKRIQLGVGEPGGVERAKHIVQAAVELSTGSGDDAPVVG